MSEDNSAAWCILRTAGPSTMGVAAALTDAGFSAWTPTYLEERRVGRQRKKVSVQGPMMPTFVFAPNDRLGELVAMARSPAQTFQVWDSALRRMVMKGCPQFSVMRHGGRYVAVPDRGLDALRQAEQRGRPAALGRVLKVGDKVKYPEAGFQGLVGVVHSVHKRIAEVYFPGLTYPVFAPAISFLPVASRAA